MKLLVLQVKQRRRLLSTFRGRKNRFFLLFDYTDFKHFSERFQEKYILKSFKAPELFRKMYFQIKFNKSGRCLNLVLIKKKEQTTTLQRVEWYVSRANQIAALEYISCINQIAALGCVSRTNQIAASAYVFRTNHITAFGYLALITAFGNFFFF